MGGCHTGAPTPLYTVKLRAINGPVPIDTTVRVRWSAGEEPLFVLEDKTTWLTLDEGSNVECDLDRSGPVPADLAELSCELWTSGSTEIEINAAGYVTYEQTIMPMELEGCDGPVPQVVDVELKIDTDAGML
jgi:hypothetical protein